MPSKRRRLLPYLRLPPERQTKMSKQHSIILLSGIMALVLLATGCTDGGVQQQGTETAQKTDNTPPTNNISQNITGGVPEEPLGDAPKAPPSSESTLEDIEAAVDVDQQALLDDMADIEELEGELDALTLDLEL